MSNSTSTDAQATLTISQPTLERIYRGSSSRAHGRPSIFGVTEADLTK
jgi:hypothetical protein